MVHVVYVVAYYSVLYRGSHEREGGIFFLLSHDSSHPSSSLYASDPHHEMYTIFTLWIIILIVLFSFPFYFSGN